MRNGVVHHNNLLHGTLSSIGTFADSVGNFVCLAEAVAYLALLVAHNDESGEGEAATALYYLGTTIHVYNLLHQLGTFLSGSLVAAATLATRSATGAIAITTGTTGTTLLGSGNGGSLLSRSFRFFSVH
jgi:hypothetical protein